MMIFQWVIWLFLFIETLLITWIFFILMPCAYWNKLWCCYTDIWVGFKENKDNFFVFYLVKIEGSLWKYHILMLIHANHFYNLELIEFKAYTAATCISIPLSNLGWFFQKISITYNLGQNCWDKIENLFFSEKTRPSQINVVHNVLDFWQQNLARFNIDIRG